MRKANVCIQERKFSNHNTIVNSFKIRKRVDLDHLSLNLGDKKRDGGEEEHKEEKRMKISQNKK